MLRLIRVSPVQSKPTQDSDIFRLRSSKNSAMAPPILSLALPSETGRVLSIQSHTVQLPAAAPVPAQNQGQSRPGIPQQYSYKNWLQQYTQRLSLPLPVYQTKNEGAAHAPAFRATVVADNTSYTSPKVFTNIKSAEQYVAKIALDDVMQKVKDEGALIILEDPIFCKAALNEYSAKMHYGLPSYVTTQQQEGLPCFSTSLVFNGVTFTGLVARNKKVAEQLAARAAILSIMGNPGPDSAMISKIVMSKYQIYANLNKGIWSNNTDNVVMPNVNIEQLATGSPLDKGKEIKTSDMSSVIQKCSSQVATVPESVRPLHEFKKAKLSTPDALIKPPIEFVPGIHEQPLAAGPSSAKKRRKKAKKNHLPIAQYPNAMAPTSHLPSGIPQ